MPKPVRIMWLAALAGPLACAPAPSYAQAPAAVNPPAQDLAAYYQDLYTAQQKVNPNPLTTQQQGLADVYWVAALIDPADEALGATIAPVGDALREQLGLPEGQGLVVASVTGDGPAAQAGLKSNDVLLELADKPLGKKDDLIGQLKSAGEGPVPLKLIREGKRLTLRVRPVYRVTLGPAVEETTDYYIGVGVAAVDDPLRAHLGLPPDRGLLANEVVKGSPAEKAGVRVHDILVEINGKPLDRTETLVQQVRAARDKPVELKLLRAGKERTVQITPAPRKVEAQPATQRERLRLWTLGQQAHPQWYGPPHNFGGYPAQPGQPPGAMPWFNQAGANPTSKRLDDLDRELKALRKAVDELRDALKPSSARGRD